MHCMGRGCIQSKLAALSIRFAASLSLRVAVLGDRGCDTQPQFIAVLLGAKRKTILDSLLLLLQAYGRIHHELNARGGGGGE
jgi:hypothetical protein